MPAPTLEKSYSRLPEGFYARALPTPVASPTLVKLNAGLARELGLDPDWLSGPDGLAMLSGNRLPEDSDPLALAYAGHQFGHFVPRLGDGRAILLGEMVDREGRRRDLQLKGSGRTPFSRGGDGRAALGPVLREYLVSEAMAAMGVPTTRSLAVVATGERVFRETALPGAILTRVAASHIRIGTFQFLAARGDVAGLRNLADYAIARHYPDAAEAPSPYQALLDLVVDAQARLVALWMAKGFIHGVMNTDNVSIAGETIDYGPCAFLDHYDPATVLSSIDQGGRYAYANQPRIAGWNLARLAETLLPLLAEDQEEALRVGQSAIDRFLERFRSAFVAIFRAKIGLSSPGIEDAELIESLLDLMAEKGADFTLTFRRLAGAIDADPPILLETLGPDFPAWSARWRARLAREPQPAERRRAAMDRVNPLFIPRNHRVEAALAAAVENQDFGPFEELLALVSDPFADRPGRAAYAEPPSPEERVRETFCGT